MDDFDSFLNEQLTRIALDERGLGRVAQKIRDKAVDVIGGGSDHAKGRLNLKAKVDSLISGFKTYCGEQQIKFSDIRLEDFVEFVRTTFGIKAEGFNQLAYGAHSGPSPHQGEISKTAKKLLTGFQDNNEGAIDDALNDLVRLSNIDKVTEMAVRKLLWQLYRNYPKRAPDLKSVVDPEGKDLIGFKMSVQKLQQTATAVAKVLLVKARAEPIGGADKATSKPETGEIEAEAPDPRDLSKKYHSDAFAKLSAEMNFSKEKFQKTAQEIERAIARRDQTVTKSFVAVFDRRYSREDCIRYTRMMLEFFYRPGSEKALDTLIDLADSATEARIKAAVTESLRIIRRSVNSGTPYDAGEVEMLFSRIISQELAAAKLLVIMIYCTNTVLS